MVDRFFGLRHDAIVGGDHQDDDVGDLGASGPHQREGLVTWGVEEHDIAPVDRDVVRPDVLRDAARLALGDARGPDRIEEARFAVIDVAHDGHDRRAGDDVLGARFVGVDLQQLLLEAPHLDVGSELARDHHGGLGVERGVDREHQPLHEQLAEHVLHTDIELGREILDRHAFGERNGPRDRRRRDRHWRRGRPSVLATLTCRGAPRATGPRLVRRTIGHAGAMWILLSGPWRHAGLLRPNGR
ncbi:MAG: hypothetical protein A3H95_07845 [Acidobacteria bacterium RIFCSPLOWO2_02_FULL_64_15]|nr:MAG: hypothetical protein A3H95_07845 [Acidobacteria bacterium RIFCSPLOWO2_02_FULL_64_15]